MKKRRYSYLVALAILVVLGGWMLTGTIIQGGVDDPTQQTIQEREQSKEQNVFRVRVTKLKQQNRLANLTVRGRTKTIPPVSLRAETGGTITNRFVNKGEFINQGDIVCVIDKGVRSTRIEQAKTQLEQAEQDYSATKELVQRGFSTKTRLMAQKTAYDTAVVSLADAEQELGRTEVKATVSGIAQDPMAEVGDNLNQGGVCVTLINNDPILFTGQVAERQVNQVKVGMNADITLATNQKANGKVKYISPIADPDTRTYEVEIEIRNPNGVIRDGMTAQANIPLEPTPAFKLKPSWLILADDGRIGVRIVNQDNTTEFRPVEIIAQERNNVWVKGLTDGTDVIILGQNYITDNQKIEPVRFNES